MVSPFRRVIRSRSSSVQALTQATGVVTPRPSVVPNSTAPTMCSFPFPLVPGLNPVTAASTSIAFFRLSQWRTRRLASYGPSRCFQTVPSLPSASSNSWNRALSAVCVSARSRCGLSAIR